MCCFGLVSRNFRDEPARIRNKSVDFFLNMFDKWRNVQVQRRNYELVLFGNDVQQCASGKIWIP